jgi:NAD+ synthase
VKRVKAVHSVKDKIMSAKVSGERLAALHRELDGDPATLVELLTRFVREETRKAGFQRVVIGLSGGIDSSLAATLAVRALGASQVLGVLMPCGGGGQSPATDHAVLLARGLGIKTELVDVAPLVEAYFAADPQATPLRRGNFVARQRMAILFDRSMRDRALVVGTSNKTELLLGYGTLFGDLASALNPLGDLYKTQVRSLSRFLALPEPILLKPPSAELWPGQTDEDELGFTYELVDQVLYLLVDRRLTLPEIAEYGLDLEFVERVAHRIRGTQFKRRLPLIAKVSARTVGLDFRYARDWGS